MDKAAPFDYLAIGHITLDLQPDGGVLPGGTVLFAALQAARLGLRTGIITRGRPEDLDAILAPYQREVTIALAPATATTTFTNSGVGAARRQRVHAWAGAIDLEPHRATIAAARVIHLGPIAQEIDTGTLPPLAPGAFVGATPQGWLRRWAGGQVTATPLALQASLLARLDALVLSDAEQAYAGDAIAALRARGRVVVVTKGEAGCVILSKEQATPVPALTCPLLDDTGAGDIFAAAFFVALVEGRPPMLRPAAARFANAAAGLSIGGRGVSGIAGRDQIERILAAQQTVH